MARLEQEIGSVHPSNRRATEPEQREIDRLYIELGKLVEAYSRVWQYGPIPKNPCHCCGLNTLDEKPPGTYEICLVCWWEDDPLQFARPDYRGGANRESLNEAREAFREHGIVGPHGRP